MHVRRILLGLLLIPLLCHSQSPSPRLGVESEASQPNAKYHHENPNKKQRGTESSPTVVKLAPSDDANPTAQTQGSRQNEQASPDWWMVIPTWLLAFFTLGLFIYTARLWRATGQLVQESRNSLQSTQRAFVFVKTFEVHNHSIPKRLIILPQWKNSGDTPTRNMLNHVNWACFDGDLPDDFDFPDYFGEERTPILIGPHATQYASPLVIDAKHIDSTICHNTRLFIWGWAEYDDVFHGTNRHRTEFCNEVLISHTPEKEVAIRFRLYRRHNGADGECAKKPSPYEPRC